MINLIFLMKLVLWIFIVLFGFLGFPLLAFIRSLQDENASIKEKIFWSCVIVFIPLFGAVIYAFVSSERKDVRYSAITLLLCIFIYVGWIFSNENVRNRFVKNIHYNVVGVKNLHSRVSYEQRKFKESYREAISLIDLLYDSKNSRWTRKRIKGVLEELAEKTDSMRTIVKTSEIKKNSGFVRRNTELLKQLIWIISHFNPTDEEYDFWENLVKTREQFTDEEDVLRAFDKLRWRKEDDIVSRRVVSKPEDVRAPDKLRQRKVGNIVSRRVVSKPEVVLAKMPRLERLNERLLNIYMKFQETKDFQKVKPLMEHALEDGLDINEKVSGFSLLKTILDFGSLEGLKWFESQGGNINLRDSIYKAVNQPRGNGSVKPDRKEMLDYLISRQQKIYKQALLGKDESGETPLMRAVKYKEFFDIAKTLIEAGEDPFKIYKVKQYKSGAVYRSAFDELSQWGYGGNHDQEKKLFYEYLIEHGMDFYLPPQVSSQHTHALSNQFVNTDENEESYFPINVQRGSFDQVNEYLDRGEIPPKELLRIDKLIASISPYLPVERPEDKPLKVKLDLGVSSLKANSVYLFVSIVGKQHDEVDHVIAEHVRGKVWFNPEHVKRYRLLEGEIVSDLSDSNEDYFNFSEDGEIVYQSYKRFVVYELELNRNTFDNITKYTGNRETFNDVVNVKLSYDVRDRNKVIPQAESEKELKINVFHEKSRLAVFMEQEYKIIQGIVESVLLLKDQNYWDTVDLIKLKPIVVGKFFYHEFYLNKLKPAYSFVNPSISLVKAKIGEIKAKNKAKEEKARKEYELLVEQHKMNALSNVSWGMSNIDEVYCGQLTYVGCSKYTQCGWKSWSFPLNCSPGGYCPTVVNYGEGCFPIDVEDPSRSPESYEDIKVDGVSCEDLRVWGSCSTESSCQQYIFTGQEENIPEDIKELIEASHNQMCIPQFEEFMSWEEFLIEFVKNKL